MRLTVAVAVLAETLPVVLSSSNHEFSHVISATSPSGNEGRIHEFLAKRKGLISLNGKHATGEKLKWMNRRRLTNSDASNLKECNPNDDGADVGILSCGTGRSCVESKASSLGGYCSAVEMSRGLQQNSSLITDLSDVCYGPDAYPACTCEGVDVDAYVGSISCAYSPECLEAPNACGDNITFCYTQTYDLKVTAPYSGSAKSCYLFNQPKELAYCYSLVIPAGGTSQFCELEVDGTKCNSCELVEQYYEGVYSDCTTFDCSNTNIATANTYCNYNIPTLQVQNTLLYDFLPCDNGCNLCGDGNSVVQKDVEFTLLNNETYVCRNVELAALAGSFEGTDLCLELADPVGEICGCASSGETETLFTCNICGDGMIVTNSEATLEVPNLGSVSCTQLEEPGFLTSLECPVVQPLVKEPCGCVIKPAPEVSESISESGSFNPFSKGAISMLGMTTMSVLAFMFSSA